MAVATNYNTAPVQNTTPTGPRADSPGTPAQLASQRANQVLGEKVTSAPVVTTAPPAPPAAGSNVLRDQMVAKGMKDVATPPSDENMRTWYSQHAPHHELIAKGDYKAAVKAYEADVKDASDKNDDQRRLDSQATLRQLEFAAKMKDSAGPDGKVSFPPTHDEAKAHFRTLKDKPGSQVAEDFKAYNRAFYAHVGEDKESKDAGVKDINYTPHKVAGVGTTTTPVGSDDIRGNLQVNRYGQRITDCEGYVQMGQDLLGEAGYSQPKGGGVHRVSNSKNPAGTGHVMLEMTRGKDERVIVNNYNVVNSDRAAYAPAQGTPLWRSIGCQKPEDMQVYRGTSLDNATQNQVSRSNKYTPQI